MFSSKSFLSKRHRLISHRTFNSAPRLTVTPNVALNYNSSPALNSAFDIFFNSFEAVFQHCVLKERGPGLLTPKLIFNIHFPCPICTDPSKCHRVNYEHIGDGKKTRRRRVRWIRRSVKMAGSYLFSAMHEGFAGGPFH